STSVRAFTLTTSSSASSRRARHEVSECASSRTVRGLSNVTCGSEDGFRPRAMLKRARPPSASSTRIAQPFSPPSSRTARPRRMRKGCAAAAAASIRRSVSPSRSCTTVTCGAIAALVTGSCARRNASSHSARGGEKKITSARRGGTALAVGRLGISERAVERRCVRHRELVQTLGDPLFAVDPRRLETDNAVVAYQREREGTRQAGVLDPVEQERRLVAIEDAPARDDSPVGEHEPPHAPGQPAYEDPKGQESEHDERGRGGSGLRDP